LSSCQRAASCQSIKLTAASSTDGIYSIDPDGAAGDPSAPFDVYCEMDAGGGGWTLVARFGVGDADTWMANGGGWWLSTETSSGTLSPTDVGDMISPAFWSVSALELRASRTDDPGATLFETTGGCLQNVPFRTFLTDLWNGSGAWALDGVQDQCTATFGGQYQSTGGFSQVGCSGDIGGPTDVSFWANWRLSTNQVVANSAVIMIGGGGDACGEADHGIGVTEENGASFDVVGETEGTFEHDFGDGGFSEPNHAYALALWVR